MKVKGRGEILWRRHGAPVGSGCVVGGADRLRGGVLLGVLRLSARGLLVIGRGESPLAERQVLPDRSGYAIVGVGASD
jgi:hypothetical protein